MDKIFTNKREKKYCMNILLFDVCAIIHGMLINPSIYNRLAWWLEIDWLTYDGFAAIQEYLYTYSMTFYGIAALITFVLLVRMVENIYNDIKIILKDSENITEEETC